MSKWKRILWMPVIAALASASAWAQPDPFAFGFAESRGDSQTESSYQRGTSALDAKQWQNAVDAFTSVPRKGPRADAALYWKAYALNKLGRRQQAIETIAELQKSFAASRWASEAKALEVEVRQGSGQPVAPEAERDDDLKLLALNSLMHTEPERAIPILETFLKGNHPVRHKQQALFVLMQTGKPRARQVVGSVARDNSNPELQAKALEYLGLFGGEESRQTLSEIYTSSSDPQVKRRILQGFMVAGDRGRLLAAAKGESNPELRRVAIQQLGVMGAETAPDLLALYASGKDVSDRKAVVQALFVQDNAAALVGLARKETNPELKRAIVQQLSVMDNKEATEYMLEILNK